MKCFMTVAVVFCSFVLSSCGRDKKVSSTNPPAPVHAHLVQMITAESTQLYTASLVPDRQVTLAFRTSGFVEQIRMQRDASGHERRVDAGDFIAKNQELARVRAQDYELQVEQAEGQLRQAEQNQQAMQGQVSTTQANAGKAAADYSRTKALFDDNAATKSDLDASQAQFESTQAQAETARSQLAASSSAVDSARSTVGLTKLNLQDTCLRMPFGGVVMQRSIEIGALVGPSFPAFSVGDISVVRAVFGVTDLDLPSIKPGVLVPISVGALGNRQVMGRISTISPTADPNTRTFQVEALVENAQLLLRPGMVVSTSLSAGSPTGTTPAVPLSALVRSKENPGGFAVMLVDGGRARRQAVKVGRSYGASISVSGLQPRDLVIDSGPALLADGEAVEVVP